MPLIVHKDIAPSLRILELNRAGLNELFITATAADSREVPAMFAAVERAIDDNHAAVVAMDVFGVPPAAVPELAVRRRAWNWPVTWLGDDRSARTTMAGVQVHAVRGVPVQRIERGGRIVGSLFDDGQARHCRLGDLQALDPSAPPDRQVRATFEFLEGALQSAGLTLANVVRTWLYLDRILSWYDSFNRVRDEFFGARNVFAGLVPASTGIGAANAAGSAVVAGAYAVTFRPGAGTVTAVPSPLQGPAGQYGSSFSRAVEVDLPDHRRLLVSGTASIDPGGLTLHPGDPDGQIELTMNVVAAILESRRLNWRDVTRAVAYLKERSQAQRFTQYCAAHGLYQLPVVLTENDICRADLLFEIEVDALQLKP